MTEGNFVTLDKKATHNNGAHYKDGSFIPHGTLPPEGLITMLRLQDKANPGYVSDYIDGCHYNNKWYRLVEINPEEIEAWLARDLEKKVDVITGFRRIE